jgi:hypothetical protein
MPQGVLEKIQVHLLLADLLLELGYAFARFHQVARLSELLLRRRNRQKLRLVRASISVRNASSPRSRNTLCHLYSCWRGTPSSRDRTVGLSPAAIRFAATNLKSRP